VNNNEPPTRYFSCLIRLWQVENGGRPAWCCSLELPGTGEKLLFPDLTALVAYLSVQVDTTPPKMVDRGFDKQKALD
jgi:hypothetical protein